LADFRRFLGDVAVESLTADHVPNYQARVLNRSICQRRLMHQAIAGGQDFLRKVYMSLTGNPSRWARTVMILTYDEYGSFFDHCSPVPIATNSVARGEVLVMGAMIMPPMFRGR
jgi:phospholipase C